MMLRNIAERKIRLIISSSLCIAIWLSIARNNARYHIYWMLPLDVGFEGCQHSDTFICPATKYYAYAYSWYSSTILVPVQVLQELWIRILQVSYDKIFFVASRAARNLDSAFSETRLETEHTLLSPEAGRCGKRGNPPLRGTNYTQKLREKIWGKTKLPQLAAFRLTIRARTYMRTWSKFTLVGVCVMPMPGPLRAASSNPVA